MSKSTKKHEQSKPHRSTLQTIALIYVALHGIIFWLTARSMPGAEDQRSPYRCLHLLLWLLLWLLLPCGSGNVGASMSMSSQLLC